MRTLTKSMFSPITIMAKYLKLLGKIVVINPVSKWIFFRISFLLVSPSIDMVNSKKYRLSNTTTRAFTPVVVNHFSPPFTAFYIAFIVISVYMSVPIRLFALITPRALFAIWHGRFAALPTKTKKYFSFTPSFNGLSFELPKSFVSLHTSIISQMVRIA